MCSIRHLLIALLLPPLVAQAVQATTIIVARTDSAIFIGADSLRTGQIEPACKIALYGDTYVVAAGPIDSPKGFDLHGLLRSASKAGGTLNEKIDAIDRALGPPIIAFLNEIRQDFLSRFQQYQSGYFLHVAIARIDESGKPLAGQIRYRPIVGPGDEISLDAHRCPPQCTDDDRLVLLGMYAEALRVQREKAVLSPNLTDAEFRDGIHALIAAQIEAEPAKVGLPINILKIDRTGARWLEREANSPCPQTFLNTLEK